MSKGPSFLVKNRFGTFYFRYFLPKSFSGYADRRIEIRRSLETNVYKLAVTRARQLFVSIEALIADYLMRKQVEDNPIEWLRRSVDELMRRDESERKERQDFFVRLIEEAKKRLGEPLEIIDFSQQNGTKQKTRRPRLSGLQATKISETIEKYCLENRVHWRAKTEFENRFLLDLLVDILGDRQIGSLTLEDNRRYKEAGLKLPKNRSKLPQYRDKSVNELIAMEIPQSEKFGARNALKYLSRARTFLTWARINGFMREEVGSVLTYKLPERDKKRRLPFSQKELRKLICSPEYKKGLHRHDHHFWLPLLGMWTGARLNELCQLSVLDVRRLNNIWVISIRDGEDQQVKNETSIRDIPIHSKLIELGFLNFVTSQRKNGEHRLFSTLSRKRDGFGTNASKWFCDYQERCGVSPLDPKRELKGFHSFRHTVSTRLANSTAPGMHERVINQLLGHEKGTSESMQTYTHAINIKALKAAVEQIQYHIDLSHLMDKTVNRYLETTPKSNR